MVDLDFGDFFFLSHCRCPFLRSQPCRFCRDVAFLPLLMPECLLRPGVLGGNMGNYPWLADSWPTSNLVHGGKEAGNCCTTSQDTTERYYNGLSSLVT